MKNAQDTFEGTVEKWCLQGKQLGDNGTNQ